MDHDFFGPKIALRAILGSKKSWPLEKSLKVADYVFCPHKK